MLPVLHLLHGNTSGPPARGLAATRNLEDPDQRPSRSCPAQPEDARPLSRGTTLASELFSFDEKQLARLMKGLGEQRNFAQLRAI